MVTGQEDELTKQFPHVDLFFRPSAVEELVEIVPELETSTTTWPSCRTTTARKRARRSDGLHADHLRLQLRLLLLHHPLPARQGAQPPAADRSSGRPGCSASAASAR